jgi:hypothetical protein
MSFGLDHAGAGDQEELPAAHWDLVRCLADVEGVGHVCYLTIAAAEVDRVLP